jgi:hypothetical protein
MLRLLLPDKYHVSMTPQRLSHEEVLLVQCSRRNRSVWLALVILHFLCSSFHHYPTTCFLRTSAIINHVAEPPFPPIHNSNHLDAVHIRRSLQIWTGDR